MMILVLYCTIVGITFCAILATILLNCIREIQMGVLACAYMVLLLFTLHLVNTMVDAHIDNQYIEEPCGGTDLSDIIEESDEEISVDLPGKLNV